MFAGSRSKKPADRSVQYKKTAVPGAPTKGPPPASTAAPGGVGPPPFPNMDPAAKRTPSYHSRSKRTPTWSSAHKRPQKRNHDDAFPTDSNRDLSQQPIRYSRDQSKDVENPGKEPSRHNSARFEVISISSDNDDGPDSDDEPLVAARKRRMTSGTPNTSGRQLKKQEPSKIPSHPSSTVLNIVTQANTPQRSHADSLPSTAKKVPPAGRISRTSSERRADDGTSEYSQSIQASESNRGKISLYDVWARRNFASRHSPNIPNVAADPNQARDSAGELGKDRISAATTSSEKEMQDLKAKLAEQVTENESLAKHLRQSRALLKTTNQTNLANVRELSTLREELGAQNQEIKALKLENVDHNETINQLHDKASQDGEDARQCILQLLNQVTRLQKLLDDQTTQNMSLDATVKDLQKEQESSKAAGSRLTKIEASNTQLREEKKQLEQKNSQMKQEIAQANDRYNALKEDKDEMIAQNDQLQLRLQESEDQLQEKCCEYAAADEDMTRQIEELQKQVSSQRDGIVECETRVADLREEVEWYKGNRERTREEWDARVAMEMKWHDDLQAIINNHNMSMAEMIRAVLAAPDPIQQAAQRDAQQHAAQQQTGQQQTAQQQTAQRQSAQRQAAKGGASRGASSSGGRSGDSR